jgi:large subunit ribosomal protein L13
MKKYRSFSQRKEDIKRDWHEVDAKGKVLGRLATEIAEKLIGKHKVTYTPHIDAGDYVVVTNAELIEVTRNKAENKIYYWHTGFPGGLKQRNFAEMIKRNPEKVIVRAVKNMLPKNRLRSDRLARLKVVIGSENPYKAAIKAK